MSVIADAITAEGALDFSGLMTSLSGFTGVFPFCIPFDIASGIKSLSASGEAPVFSFDLGYADMKMEIDMSTFETVAVVFRVLMLFIFVTALALITSMGIVQNIINGLTAAVNGIVGVLPGSLFEAFIQISLDSQLLKALNWIIPINSMVAILEAWLVSIGVWYVVQIVLQDIEWQTMKGRNGWTKSFYNEGIRILFDGREDLGVEISGKGCRALETYNNNEFKWSEFLAFLISEPEQMNVSRLDIACDDHEGILDMKTMYGHVKSRKFISKAKRCIWTDGDEQSIVIGSPQSDTRLRIYNKGLERGVNQHWIRAEMQLRDKAADSFIMNLVQKKRYWSYLRRRSPQLFQIH